MIVSNKLEKKIEKKILTIDDYSFEPQEQYNLNLEDHVILYNSGNEWKIIPLDIMLSYPIIYDNYAHEDEKYDISIILCPVTLRGSAFKEKFTFSHYDEYRMILRGDNDLIPIDLNYKINDNLIIQENKRIEIKIMTLRNAIIYAPDAVYMKCNKKIKSIINIKYYSNNKDINDNELEESLIHPKTLVYIVKYSSNTTKEEKYAILVGNDTKKNIPTGYDLNQSKLNDHLLKYQEKIINKNGYTMPMLYYTAKKVYENAKIVFLS